MNFFIVTPPNKNIVKVEKVWLEQLLQLAESAKAEQEYLNPGTYSNQTNMLIDHALTGEDYLEAL